MSLYMATDRPAPASKSRVATSKDVFGTTERQVPKNPKYADVRSTLNTGANAGNVKPKIDRSGEPFRRVNRRQLHHLMLACEQGDESIYELQNNWDAVEDTDDASSVRSGHTVSSTLSASSTQSVLPLVATHSHQQDNAPQTQASDYFILLDMRDDEDVFKKYHIQGAMHYPPALLRRDHFPPALYAMRNKPDKLIILYDADETSRVALECCMLFIQKGFSNVFLLTGGIARFAEKYLSRLEGTHPPQPPKAKSAAGVSSRSQAMAGTPAGARISTGATSRLNTGASAAAPSSRLQTGASARPAMQSHSATSLGYNTSARLSPRAQLERTFQQQQQQPAAAASAASSRSQRPPPTGSSAISSRAFR